MKSLPCIAAFCLIAVVAHAFAQESAPKSSLGTLPGTIRTKESETAPQTRPVVPKDKRVVRVEATIEGRVTPLHLGQRVHLYQQANFAGRRSEYWIAGMLVDPCTICEIHSQRANRADVSLVVSPPLAEHLADISAESKPILFLATDTGWPHQERVDVLMKVFQLVHLKAADAERLISELYRTELMRQGGLTLSADERSNTLIVRGDVGTLNEIEALLARLDEENDEPSPARSDSSAIRSWDELRMEMAAPGGGLDSNLGRPSIEELRKYFNELEAQTQQLALKLRAIKTGPQELQAAKDKLATDLRQSVRQAFEVRQQLQREELVEFQQRMRRIEQTIKSRDRIAEQIIDRRIEDLLNPDRRWESNGVKDRITTKDTKSTKED